MPQRATLLFSSLGDVINPLLAQITHSSFAEVADAIRSEADQITLAWDAAVREAMPQMQHLTFDELKDSTPQILAAISDALASTDPDVIRELLNCAPAQGLSRFNLKFDVIEIMQEDRLLRAITVEHVEAAMGRRMDVPESAALHAAIDLMLQRSVIAFVEQQKAALRVAAQIELKFLSFLSHDLNNNLGCVTLWLGALELELQSAIGFADAVASLRRAQNAIDDTVGGMRRMLDHERLRSSGRVPIRAAVDLHVLATKAADQIAWTVEAKNVKLSVEVAADTIVNSDEELLSIILQNLLGNAAKFSSGGTIRIGANKNVTTGRTVLWVSDEGPGIAPDKLGIIFEAFRRGDVHGQSGIGLGLAIASQAAKMLGAELTAASTVGSGSNFRLSLAT